MDGAGLELAAMARIALGVEYDGTDFVGWQAQRNGRSVQSILQTAIGFVADGPVVVTVAGRTDAGVHAANQVLHFDTEAQRSERQWVLGVNAQLPGDVAVRWARHVDDRFDARRSALARRYRYRILERPSRPALARRQAWWSRRPLDCAAMLAAASYWLGENDFTSFRAAGCQSRTPMRRLLRVAVERTGEIVSIEFTANAFLQHMVRNFVGVLVAIGHGDAEPVWARDVLLARDRRVAGIAAPPAGLCLVEVLYPPSCGVPAAVEGGAEFAV